jgi:hypothetical protein
VGGDHRVEVVVGHLPQDLVAQDARVGDQDVEPAELLDGTVHQPLGGLGRADRDDLGDGGAAGRGDGLHGLLGHGLVDVVDDHGGAVGGEGVRIGEAEAPAAAGDDGDLAGEIDAGHERVPSSGGTWVRLPRSKLRAIIVNVNSC